ncbi:MULTISPECIES: DUF4998 domain-containing protein [Butyricimonas]|uniref:DUF4998 domain-containing protein n=1 Tax=Butyricimonas TaxID=574697 RepID=UPI0016526E4C|nr:MULTISPECIES: DUF4998 domain-containing protein [Butyricimonas]
MKKYFVKFLIATLALAGCSESLEDTYDEYTDGGRIRYVGRCYDAKVVPGWQSLTVKWDRATDETVKNIKVVWSLNEQKDSALLEPSESSFKIDRLADGTYRFDITAIDDSGENSLVETVYGRPYTESHEVVRTFTNVVTKSWQVGNKLVCRMDQWNENILEVQLKYKNTRGEVKPVKLRKEDFMDPENPDLGQFYVLDDVSDVPTDSIVILRRGLLENCPDEIDFPSVTVNKNRAFTTDFVVAIKERYGFSDVTDEELAKLNHFVDTVRVLEFDYDITSLEDVLYCPRLEKVVIGKNRYLTTQTEEADKSVLEELEKSVAILNLANEYRGVTIERYGKHYFKKTSIPFMTDFGLSVLPDLDYVDRMEIDSITCSIVDERGDLTLERLLDDDPETRWETTNVGTLRAYDLIIYLKEEMDIRGVKIAQPVYDWWDMEVPGYMTSSVQVKTSTDLVMWEDASYVEENTIGKGSGESVLVPVREGSRKARYVKITVNDQVSGVNSRIMLGDIMVFK